MSTLRKVKAKTATNTIDFNIEIFNSADEVSATCDSRTVQSGGWYDMRERMKTSPDPSFRGVESYEEALDLMRTGYQPIVDKLKTQIKANISGSGKRITFRNNIVGYAPIVPLALKGVPNCMIDAQAKPIKCKVIDVYYDSTFNCGISTEQIIEAGSKALAAIIDLEQAGYRFNLYAVQAYTDDFGRSMTSDMLVVKVKSSAQPLDLKRISFPLAHPAFFRVIGFDWYSKVPGGTYRSAYGTQLQYVTTPTDRRSIGKQLFGDNAVFITGQEILKKGEDSIKEVLTNVGTGNGKEG